MDTSDVGGDGAPSEAGEVNWQELYEKERAKNANLEALLKDAKIEIKELLAVLKENKIKLPGWDAATIRMPARVPTEQRCTQKPTNATLSPPSLSLPASVEPAEPSSPSPSVTVPSLSIGSPAVGSDVPQLSLSARRPTVRPLVSPRLPPPVSPRGCAGSRALPPPRTVGPPPAVASIQNAGRRRRSRSFDAGMLPSMLVTPPSPLSLESEDDAQNRERTRRIQRQGSAKHMMPSAIFSRQAKRKGSRIRHEEEAAMTANLANAKEEKFLFFASGTSGPLVELIITTMDKSEPLATDRKAMKEWKRLRALQELLMTEAAYVRDLEILADVWLRPLVAQKFLKPAEIQGIFLNMEVLLGVNQSLVEQMITTFCSAEDVEKRASTRSQDNYVVGTVFLHFANFLKTYSTYMQGHDSSIEVLENCRKHNSQFAAFLERTSAREECRGLSLQSFLVKPVQRLCKYPLLLKQILHLTDENHADYASLKAAMAKLEDVTSNINESIRQKENQEKVLEIARKLNGLEAEELVTPTRHFVREATFIKVSKGKPQERHFFLFNDILVYAKIVNRKRGEFLYKDKLPLQIAVCMDLPQEKKFKHAFQLSRLDKKMKKYIICAESAEQKEEWMQLIMDQHHLCAGKPRMPKQEP